MGMRDEMEDFAKNFEGAAKIEFTFGEPIADGSIPMHANVNANKRHIYATIFALVDNLAERSGEDLITTYADLTVNHMMNKREGRKTS